MEQIVDLQHRAGNEAVSTVLQRQLAPETAVTPASIDAALKSVTLVSSRTTPVTSLRPWEIFRTLPWNPSDGGKKRLFGALRKAHATLRRARATLAEAVVREEVAATAATAKPVAVKPKSARPARSGKSRSTAERRRR